MKKTLRPYQQASCQEIAKSWSCGERPYISVMTGLGKSLIAAALINRYINAGERVLCLVPRLELVQQNYQEAFDYIDDKTALGIVCGQLSKRQNHKQAVIAMSTSFVSLRATSGKFDRIIVDECHRLHWRHPDQKPGTIQKIITSQLRINPNCKVGGMTGTPYRLDQGELHEKSHKALPFFTHKVYDTSIEPGIKRLIEDGYLSHINTLNTPVHADLSGLRVSGDDYNKNEMGVKFDAIIEDAVEDMRGQFERNNIRTAIIFASNLANARKIIMAWGQESTMRIVCGDESICTKTQRKSAVDWIKNGSGNRYIINVDILAEGFDHRALDCVVLLRATISPGLLVQMVGRVIRPHDDKECGYLIDYGTNLERLTTGGIENIIVPKVKLRAGDAPKKLCTAIYDVDFYSNDKGFYILRSDVRKSNPITDSSVYPYYKGTECNHANLLSAKKCSRCQADFIASENEEGKYTMRTRAQALQAKLDAAIETLDVESVEYELAYSRKDGTMMIKALYYGQDFELIHTHYICLDHKGTAGDLSKRFLMGMFKDVKDFYKLGAVGVSCDNIITLLTKHPHYFKIVDKITLAPAVGSRFKDLKGVTYK